MSQPPKEEAQRQQQKLDAETFLIQNDKVTLNVTLYPLNTKKNENETTRIETVLLLHGGPGVPTSMIEVVKAIHAKQKYQIITFEQRGTGNSINPLHDYSREGYMSDITAIANHFHLIHNDNDSSNKFHIFGHSWGGLYGQIYANEYPQYIKSLFLSSPSIGTNTDWQLTEKEVLQYNQKHSSSINFCKMGWYSLLGSLWESDVAYQKLFALVIQAYQYDFPNPETKKDDDNEVDLSSIRAIPIKKTRPNIVAYKSLPAVVGPTEFPITITYGDNDIYGTHISKVFDRYPSAKHHVIENCGHLPWAHNPIKFRSIIDEFY